MKGESREAENFEGNISKRPAREEDRDFARHVHHAAYHDVVMEQFGNFVEEQQDTFFNKSWDSMTFEILQYNGTDAGYSSVKQYPDHIFIQEVVILPEYQGKSIGTKVLREIMSDAQAKNLPLRLQVLKKNPARELYERLGFKQFAETDTHFEMELLPSRVED